MKKKLRYYLPKKYKYPKIAEICWIKLAENSIDYFGGQNIILLSDKAKISLIKNKTNNEIIVEVKETAEVNNTNGGLFLWFPGKKQS
jgi:hypothetical protein